MSKISLKDCKDIIVDICYLAEKLYSYKTYIYVIEKNIFMHYRDITKDIHCVYDNWNEKPYDSGFCLGDLLRVGLSSNILYNQSSNILYSY